MTDENQIFIFFTCLAFVCANCKKPDDDKSTLPFEMILVKGETFTMGQPDPNIGGTGWSSNEQPAHSVTLSSFYMGKYEVTQRLWYDIMGTRPSYFTNCDDCPVERVSWYDIQTFLTALNTKYPGNNFRLPTEAEWEYAARAATTTPFNTGNCLATSQANFDGNYPYQSCAKGTYANKTVVVDCYAPNDWDLYDMHGNVWEWCQDDWHGNYTGAPTDGNAWVDGSGSYRVYRGGGWYDFANYCRVALRNTNDPTPRSYNVGFRVVRSL